MSYIRYDVRSVCYRPLWSNANSSSKKRWIRLDILSRHLQMHYVISFSLPPSSRNFWRHSQRPRRPAQIVLEVCGTESSMVADPNVFCLLGSVASNAPSGAFASPIPWRKLGVRHNHNEILFDVTEEMRAIVGRYVAVMMVHRRIGDNPVFISNGGTLTSDVYGKIDTNAKLTGRHTHFSIGSISDRDDDRHAGSAPELFESERHDGVCVSPLRQASVVGSVVGSMILTSASKAPTMDARKDAVVCAS